MKTSRQHIAVRWTMGDVSRHGFEALKLSIWSANQLFPPDSDFTVCVNSISIALAKKLTGEIPSKVSWLEATAFVPSWLKGCVDAAMAEGVAWKLAPVRLFPDSFEISLDNDVVLWRIPRAMRSWLKSESQESVLLAEDVQSSLGQFSALAGNRAINSGIRGLPPGYDYESDLRRMLDVSGLTLRSELDEQGLQAATLAQKQLVLVAKEDVTICSPFPMHQQYLGTCGAHFVGLNQKQLPWRDEAGRPMHEAIHAAWLRYMEQIEERISAPVGAMLRQHH